MSVSQKMVERLSDSIQLRGEFRAYVIDRGVPSIHAEDKNLIVNLARKNMAHLVSLEQTNSFINTFKLGGDNTLSSPELITPNNPTITDTALVYSTNLFTRSHTDTVTNSGGTVPAWSVTFPSTPNETSVLFTILIGANEANLLDPTATSYSAAGLFINTQLFASKTFPVMTKTPDREFAFEWEIRF